MKQKYITATEFGKQVVIDGCGRTVRFITSAAFLNDSWDVFAGQMFKMDRDRLVVEPFTLPDSWQRSEGIAAPAARGQRRTRRPETSE